MTMLRMLAAIGLAALLGSAVPVRAEVKTQWVEYEHGDAKLKAYMAFDDAVQGKRPAILMIHAREGMTPKTLQLTENWAKLGYVVFAADIFGYGHGVLPKSVAEMTAQTDIYTKDRELMRARTQAAYDTLAKQPMVDAAKVALIGYCFGGAVGVEFGATGAPLTANVSIHGSFRGHPTGWAKSAKGMFLILHGSEDKDYSLTKAVEPVIEELREAKRPFQLELYGGTGHGFSSPKNADEERANTQSIATTARTLKELWGS